MGGRKQIGADAAYWRGMYEAERDGHKASQAAMLRLLELAGWEDHPNAEIRGQIRQMQARAVRHSRDA